MTDRHVQPGPGVVLITQAETLSTILCGSAQTHNIRGSLSAINSCRWRAARLVGNSSQVTGHGQMSGTYADCSLFIWLGGVVTFPQHENSDVDPQCERNIRLRLCQMKG